MFGKNILLLLLVAAASAQNCSHNFEEQSYTRTAILSIKGLPTNLVFNPNNKELLFTLIDLDSLHNDDVQTKMDQYILRKGEAIKVDNIRGQASAVDVVNNKVYIGTEMGLAVMNDTNKATYVCMIDEDIVQLFKPAKKHVLYATLFPENEVFIIDLDKNEKTKIDSIPCAYFLAVDDKENVFYECNSKSTYNATMLTIFTIFPLFFSAATADPVRARCDGTNINNLYYKRELLATIDGYATNMAIDSKTDNIYFVLHKKNYTKGIHVLKHASLGIKELPVSDDLIGQCVVVDDFNNIIYVGTNQGLLTYDDTKSVISAERPLGDDDIRSMFIDAQENQLFITTGSNHEVYRFINGSAAVKRYERVPKAYSIVVDKKGNAFYEYIDGRMYTFPSDLFEPVQFKGFSRELKYILKLNKRDEVIVAVKGSLFKLTTRSMLPKKIGQLGFKITGLTFDLKNNMIVGTKGKIYRYAEIGDQDPCPSEDYFMSSI